VRIMIRENIWLGGCHLHGAFYLLKIFAAIK